MLSAPRLAGSDTKPLQLALKAFNIHRDSVKTCFLSLRKGVWTSLDIPESSIFMEGSFKISVCYLSARVNLTRISDQFLFSLEENLITILASKSLHNRSKITLTRPKTSKRRPRSILKLPKPAQELPRGAQDAPKSVPAGSKTAPGPTSDLPRRHQEGFITIQMHSDLFSN